MKNIIFTLCLFLIAGLCYSQTKTSSRKAPPYVYKKEFNEKMLEMNDKLTAVQASNSAIISKIRKGNDSFYILKNNIDTIIKILNEYNIKIQLTSDSLTELTSFSIEEFREVTKNDIAQLQKETKSANRIIAMGVIGLGILLILLIIAFIILNTRINQRLHELDDDIEEGIEESDVKHTKETEKLIKSIKRELSRDIDLFRYSLENKITKLNDKVATTGEQLRKESINFYS